MSFRDYFPYFSRRSSYAQHGEDIILMSHLENISNGFFVDVGAHHPFRFSNTYLFYRRGWRGINIDPKPGTKKFFDTLRPGDINLETGIAEKEGLLTYYMFDEPALNSFSKELSDERDQQTSYKIIGTKEIPVQRLDKVLHDYLPAGKTIDFLTVDVEGLDVEVLCSNDWEKFRPTLIVAEDMDLNLNNLRNSPVCDLLLSKDYDLVGKTLTSLIFKSAG
jgi:FkbM family methyltransferase